MFIQKSTAYLAVAAALVAFVAGCGTQKKYKQVTGQKMSATIQLPEQADFIPEVKDVRTVERDTLKVTDLDGKEVLIMKAVRDDESGEMVATEQLTAAVVTARFRNIAERHGKIDLEFQVIVPSQMQDSKWQLRMHPDMFILEDSIRLDDVVVTGDEYRRRQLKGYEQYNRFLGTIVEDSAHFIDLRNLEIFLQRNIPQLYGFKEDSTEVSDEEFASVFGVTEREAVDHYTNKLAKRANEKRKNRRDKMFERYVKTPIVTEGVRLDTIIRGESGEFIYNYVQTINTRPRLRKVDIVLCGDIYEQERRLYEVPKSDPLTFYISSVATFTDETERYVTMIVSRNVAANAESHIDFEKGKTDIREDFGGNAGEIGYIKDNIRQLLVNPDLILDSITITSSSSPEGARAENEKLSLQRARSVSDYFSRYTKHLKDSIIAEQGMFISIGDDLTESDMRSAESTRDISFQSYSGGENWTALENFVITDTVLTDPQKEDFRKYLENPDVDARERQMYYRDWYKYVSNTYYPMLRTVRFDFALHRKGMVKDTVHTTVLDTAYMNAVQLLKDHDYEKALNVLRPYQDFNTAVCYVALDYNKSAMAILEKLERTSQVNYMLALLYAREGDDQNAVQCYMNSCQQDRSYVSRGNLDPEISALIKKYNLNAEPDDDEWGDLGF